MNKKTGAYPAAVPIEPFFQEQMKDPEFRHACDELEPEFQLVQQLIELRLKRKISQSELARRIGVLQPSIARLESRGQTRDLSFLTRMAHALGARLEIRLIPDDAPAKKTHKRKVKV